jgi:Tfp pilus assembly protein PilF
LAADVQTVESALAADREDPVALHLLGVLCLEAGQPEAAAGLVSRALQQRPDAPEFYNTLGNALRGLRRFESAVLSFRKAISLYPAFAEAMANLGSALEESGQPGEAVERHRRAPALGTDCDGTHGNLGKALRSSGAPVEARAALTARIAGPPVLRQSSLKASPPRPDMDISSGKNQPLPGKMPANPTLDKG